MHEQPPQPPERLDSWKAIADYLDRDVATVRRWERLHKLPVRRIAGSGRSVYAYVSEIDEWLRAKPPAERADTAGTNHPTEAVADATVQTRPWRWPLVAAVLLVASGLFWSIPLWTSEPLPFRAEMVDSGIVAFDNAGRQMWKHSFSSEDRAIDKPPYADLQVLNGPDPGVIAATAYYQRLADDGTRSGELLWFTPKGTLARTFSFEEGLTVGGKPYGQPWVMTDFSVDGSGSTRRIAVTGRHYHWWPSLVTVLDAQWRRQGTFYNAGWIDQVHWVSGNRLLLSGYANAHDAGMVAIVDATALDGQSPRGADPKFDCSTCGPESAVRYVVLPRSEVNQALGTSINGAIVQVLGERVLVRTIEFHRPTEAVEVLYEFTRALELVHASYGDRYWEMHKSLEADGRINHTRDLCPHRDGPQGMTVWERTKGWQKLAQRASR